MKSRPLIKQCFTCKNNVECWHLNDELPEGREARKNKIKPFSMLKFLLKRWFEGSYKTIFAFEYVSVRGLIDVLNPKLDKETSHRYTQQCMAVIECMGNSQTDSWCCPGDDPEDEEGYKYMPRDE